MPATPGKLSGWLFTVGRVAQGVALLHVFVQVTVSATNAWH